LLFVCATEAHTRHGQACPPSCRARHKEAPRTLTVFFLLPGQTPGIFPAWLAAQYKTAGEMASRELAVFASLFSVVSVPALVPRKLTDPTQTSAALCLSRFFLCGLWGGGGAWRHVPL